MDITTTCNSPMVAIPLEASKEQMLETACHEALKDVNWQVVAKLLPTRPDIAKMYVAALIESALEQV